MIVKIIVAKTTPRAIKSFLKWSNAKNKIKLRIAPKVRSFPKFPDDRSAVTPCINSYSVNAVIKMTVPMNADNNPSSIPINKSIFFI